MFWNLLLTLIILGHNSKIDAGLFNFQGEASQLNLKGNSNLHIKTQLTANGNIKKSSTAIITGDTASSKIIFEEGFLDQNNSTNSSSLVLNTTNSLALDGTKSFKANDGTTLESVTVSGISNILTGAPVFSGTVTLASGSDVTVGISSKMNVDVALGSGTFKLSDDLRFSDNKRFIGTGTVNLQNYKLKFGAKPLAFTSAITWFNASDIDLGGLTTLSSTWTFTGDAVINGNGNVLDISSTGVIAINAGTTVSIADTYIKGLGSTGDITFANNTTSILRLSNVVIEMTGSKTISGGQVIIDGPTTIITKNNTLTFSSGGVLTINGQTLLYDRLGNFSGGISPMVAGANLVLNNGGRILETNINDQPPGAINIAASTTLPIDLFVSEDHPLSISATSTLSGNGHKIKFSDRSATQISIANSITLTTSDLVLEDLQPSQISLGSGSAIIFGNNTTVRLGKNSTLNSTWKFSGASMLNGQNKMLTLGSAGVIEAQASSTLTLKDLTIYDINGTNLRCLDNTGSIIFDNVKLINRNRWRFQNGSFAVTNNLSMLGGGTFSYESAYASTINDNSSLVFSNNMTFSYDPAKGSGQAVASQQNLVFTNTSSKLICDGVTLKITNTGLRLTTGTLQVDRQNSIYCDANTTDIYRGLIFGNKIIDNDLQIIIGPDAKLDLNTGSLRYENVEDNYLRYGDGIVLRHKTYGFYVSNSTYGTGGAYGNWGVGTASVTNSSRFYVQPGSTNTRFGTGFIGTIVTSGDPVRLESFSTPGSGPFLGLNPDNGAVVSTPSPPYYLINFNASPNGFVNISHRIYRKGGAFGSKIRAGDEVYIQGLTTYPAYLGSSNNVYGSDKEIFYYRMPDTSSSTPPSFDTQYIWIIDTIIKDAYLNNPTNTSVTVSTLATPAANYQF